MLIVTKSRIMFCSNQLLPVMDCYSYTLIRHNICLKTVLFFCKPTVLKVMCYQNIYTDKHGRIVHMHKFIGDMYTTRLLLLQVQP